MENSGREQKLAQVGVEPEAWLGLSDVMMAVLIRAGEAILVTALTTIVARSLRAVACVRTESLLVPPILLSSSQNVHLPAS